MSDKTTTLRGTEGVHMTVGTGRIIRTVFGAFCLLVSGGMLVVNHIILPLLLKAGQSIAIEELVMHTLLLVAGWLAIDMQIGKLLVSHAMRKASGK